MGWGGVGWGGARCGGDPIAATPLPGDSRPRTSPNLSKNLLFSRRLANRWRRTCMAARVRHPQQQHQKQQQQQQRTGGRGHHWHDRPWPQCSTPAPPLLLPRGPLPRRRGARRKTWQPRGRAAHTRARTHTVTATAKRVRHAGYSPMMHTRHNITTRGICTRTHGATHAHVARVHAHSRARTHGGQRAHRDTQAYSGWHTCNRRRAGGAGVVVVGPVWGGGAQGTLRNASISAVSPTRTGHATPPLVAVPGPAPAGGPGPWGWSGRTNHAHGGAVLRPATAAAAGEPGTGCAASKWNTRCLCWAFSNGPHSAVNSSATPAAQPPDTHTRFQWQWHACARPPPPKQDSGPRKHPVRDSATPTRGPASVPGSMKTERQFRWAGTA